MKKLLLGLTLGAIFASQASAGLWSTASGFTMKEKKPSASYTIDTAGINPRVYEFNSADNKMKCVVVFTTVNGGSTSSMQCIDLRK
jgi:hypothetical protein